MQDFPAARRIASLQPSVTVILHDLGKLDLLAACTKYCAALVPEVAARRIPVIADSWAAQSEEIRNMRPDLVIASVPYQEKSLAEILRTGIPVLALSPKKLADIYSDIALIARLVDAEEAGNRSVSQMKAQIDGIRRSTEGLSRPRVFCEEWGKPLIASQPWVAELVHVAGGEFVGTPGARIDAVSVAAEKPEVLIAAWCGAGDRVPLNRIVESRMWQDLPAVNAGRVYCIKDEYLNTPAPNLVHGLRALAAAIHPAHFPQVDGVRCIRPD